MKKSLAMMAMLMSGILAVADPAPASVSLNPEALALKAGEITQVEIAINAPEGTTARNWWLSLIRKNSPEGFFEKLPSFDKHATAPGYDNVKLINVIYLPENYTSGTEIMKLNTQGFIPGDYAFLLGTDFVAPGKATRTVYASFCLTITEGDNKPVIINQENTPFFQVCQSSVTEFTVKPGANYTFIADVQLQARCSASYARAYILRKDLPAEFAQTVQTWTKGKTEAEDEFELSHNSFRGVNKGRVYCYIASGNLPEGDYNVIVQFQGEKSAGSSRQTYTAELPVKMTVKGN